MLRKISETFYSVGDFWYWVIIIIIIIIIMVVVIIIIIIIHSLELFTSALADGFSMESEWHQFSSSLQDSSQYSGRS